MTDDLHALSGAYAVGAVDDVERVRFERHLSDCPGCRLEVDGLRETASLLAAVSASPPSASVRSTLLAEVATTRPLPPILVRADGARRVAPRRLPRLIAAAAAFAVIGGAVTSVWHPWETTPVAATSIAQSELDQVLHAPDLKRTETSMSGGGTAVLLRAPSAKLAVFEAPDMPKLPRGKVYELWLIHGSTFERAGLIRGGQQDVKLVLSGDPTQATAAGVTVEKAGGSDQPNSGMVAGFSFENA